MRQSYLLRVGVLRPFRRHPYSQAVIASHNWASLPDAVGPFDGLQMGRLPIVRREPPASNNKPLPSPDRNIEIRADAAILQPMKFRCPLDKERDAVEQGILRGDVIIPPQSDDRVADAVLADGLPALKCNLR